MPDILQDFPIKAEPSRVFDAVSTPAGLNQWWTRTCGGEPAAAARWHLGFGPRHQWRAVVTRYQPPAAFELTFEQADADWAGTRVGFDLSPTASGTQVRFYHLGWPAANEHYRVSCHCWALYLRILRRYLEHGEVVAYESRLDA
jgi:uncharacterized protein YndB with AHSA1/START domain